MKKNIRQVSIFLLLIAIATLAIFQPAGMVKAQTDAFRIIETVWGSPAAPLEASPGDVNTQLTVRLQCTWKRDIIDIQARLLLPEGFTDSSSGSDESWAFKGPTQLGSIFELQFTLNIASTAALGEYSMALRIRCRDITLRQYTENYKVTVFLGGKVDVEFTAVPEALTPGRVNQLQITVKNNGKGQASNLSVSITAPGQVSLLSPQTVELGALPSGSSANVTSRIYVPPSMQSSPLSLTFTVSYKDAYGNLRTSSQMVGLYVEAVTEVSFIDVWIEPVEVVSGEVNDLMLFIKNNGTKAVENVEISVSFPASNVVLLSSSVRRVDELKAGVVTPMNLQVYVPSTMYTTVQASVAILYTDFYGVTGQEVRNVGLLARGVVDMKLVDFTVIPVEVEPGKLFSVTSTMTNLGTITAYAVSATPVIEDVPFEMFGAETVFIGDVQVNIPTTFTVSFMASDVAAPGGYDLQLNIRYMDNLRTVHTTVVSIPVKVVALSVEPSTNQASEGVWGLVQNVLGYVAAGVLMLIVGYAVGRRRRSK